MSTPPRRITEVKAGKMYMKGTMVYPDPRKGQIFLYMDEDFNLHFCWEDRTTNVVEDDLILLPGDCEYIAVPKCTTGRVFLLRFKSSKAKHFFWMQEPKKEKDARHFYIVNDFLYIFGLPEIESDSSSSDE